MILSINSGRNESISQMTSNIGFLCSLICSMPVAKVEISVASLLKRQIRYLQQEQANVVLPRCYSMLTFIGCSHCVWLSSGGDYHQKLRFVIICIIIPLVVANACRYSVTCFKDWLWRMIHWINQMTRL